MGAAEKKAIFVVAFALSICGAAYAVRSALHSEYGECCGIPVDIGPWKGMNMDADIGSIRALLGAQEVVYRAYRQGIDVIVLYVAFYKDINAADKVHAPVVCYAGQGWQVAQDDVVVRRIGRKFEKINRIIIQKSRSRELVYNWWQTGEKVIPRNSVNRFYQMFMAITGRNPSTVWIRMSISSRKDLEKEEQTMMRFCRELRPLLPAAGRKMP